MGAVPHRTYPGVSSPWAAPGAYTVRLTVGGKSYTQPISLKMDPRIKTPALVLAQLASLSNEMYNAARETRAAYNDARAASEKLGSASGADAAALKAKIDSIAPPAAAGGGRGGRGGGGRGNILNAGAPARTLEGASVALNAAAMGMQGADVAPTANELAACTKAKAQAAAVMLKWKALSAQAAKLTRGGA
jgi:hypothetical protein